jgi:hypothetical protein
MVTGFGSGGGMLLSSDTYPNPDGTPGDARRWELAMLVSPSAPVRAVDHLPPGAVDGFAVIDAIVAPDILVVDDFVAPEDCADLVAYHRRERERCAVIGGGCEHFSGRVLYPDGLPPSAERDLARNVAAEISRAVEMHLSGGRPVRDDGAQIVWWPPPHGMGWHSDDVLPGRAFSGLLYLNDGYRGGYTAFRDLGVMLRPKPGRLCIYSGSVTHGVTDVTEGERFTMPSFHRLVAA